MIFLVSGEGATDLGICNNGGDECSGEVFRAGPMAVIIDRLVEPLAGYSLLEYQSLRYVSKSAVAAASKKLPMAISAGKKRDYETAFFFKNARALARMAKALETPDCPVAAVLFRDSDGTRSSRAVEYKEKWQSMEDGFKAEKFDNGIPMIPKPKSEAWLICAVKNAYAYCASLEDTLSGNDDSPNPAKQQLDAALTEIDKTIAELAEMVSKGEIDSRRINMPSYNQFRQRLEAVTRKMLGQPSEAI